MNTPTNVLIGNQESSGHYCKFGHFRKNFIFMKLRSFMKIKPLRNAQISLSFTDLDKSFHSRNFLMWQICLLTLSGEIKFSQKISNLHYLFGKKC